jgi:hypothetical protein
VVAGEGQHRLSQLEALDERRIERRIVEQALDRYAIAHQIEVAGNGLAVELHRLTAGDTETEPERKTRPQRPGLAPIGALC